MSVPVLLDTNAYLRLARRVRPLLGVEFGQKQYVLTVLGDVEEEVLRSKRLRHRFPWFETDKEVASERLAKRVRLSREKREELEHSAGFLHDWVIGQAQRFVENGRAPPSAVDCRVLAYGQLWQAIVVTDDLAMHDLAGEFSIDVWHGHELLARLRSGRMVDNDQVRDIYAALEANGDLPATWRAARDKSFPRVFLRE